MVHTLLPSISLVITMMKFPMFRVAQVQEYHLYGTSFIAEGIFGYMRFLSFLLNPAILVIQQQQSSR